MKIQIFIEDDYGNFVGKADCNSFNSAEMELDRFGRRYRELQEAVNEIEEGNKSLEEKEEETKDLPPEVVNELTEVE